MGDQLFSYWCKVVKVRDAVEVNGGKFKQDISVGDLRGGHVILWEEHIGSLQAGGSYQLAGFLVHEFAGKKASINGKRWVEHDQYRRSG